MEHREVLTERMRLQMVSQIVLTSCVTGSYIWTRSNIRTYMAIKSVGI
jgi:hypothetical protein